MTTLHDRLNELADDVSASVATGDLDADLWKRGKRLQRRRQVASASFAAVLVLAIGSLATVVVDATSGPELPAADADATLALPDELYLASPWANGTEETGPIGPLAALVGAERRTFWGDSTLGVTGVTPTGDYAFLDLESRAETYDVDPGVKLSADGERVAYLLTGETDEEANTFQGDPVVGLAVLDTVTGTTTEQRIPTDHGLEVDDFTWIGDTLVMRYSQYLTFEEGSSTSTRPVLLRWNLKTGAADAGLPRSSYPDLFESAPAGDRVVVTSGRRTFVIVSADGETEPGPRLDVATDSPVFLSPDGRRLATNKDPDGPHTVSNLAGPVVVGPATGAGAGTTRKVEPVVIEQQEDGETMTGSVSSVSSVEAAVVGWRDNDHLVVAAGDGYEVIDVTDVTLGFTEPLVTLPQAYGMQPQVADDALQAPTFAAAEPDGPGDPRRILWLGGGLLVTLAGAAFWRSRVRL
jgi:hypothetical protein